MGLIFVAALLICACWLDRPFMLWLDANVSPALNHVFEVIGMLGNPGIYLGLALFVYGLSLAGMAWNWRCPVAWGFERGARGAMLVMATMALGGGITWLLKRLVSRARPEELLQHDIYGVGVHHWFSGSPYDSFPSSHTQAAFVLAAVMGILAPRWRYPALAVATLVALSRLVNRDHFLSDVMAGAAVALLSAAWVAPRVLDSRYCWPLRAPWHWLRRRAP